MKKKTRNASCYHHSINEPTKVVELEPQEQNMWNNAKTKMHQENDNVFYSKHVRNKASSDSSMEQYNNGRNMVNHDTIIRYFSPNDGNIHVSIREDPGKNVPDEKV